MASNTILVILKQENKLLRLLFVVQDNVMRKAHMKPDWNKPVIMTLNYEATRYN